MHETLNVSPTPFPRKVKAADGKILEAPSGWQLLPPGDAGVTRRLKQMGPSWTVAEKRGRKVFSQGVWAPAENIEKAKASMETVRSAPSYEKEKERAKQRRDEAQAAFAASFEKTVFDFLNFSAPFEGLARQISSEIAAHAAPVGSGTVARTASLEIEDKAEAAVIAWMRHKTTAYDNMSIARVKGRRREVRRNLAESSRALLDRHRKSDPHEKNLCSLCLSVASPAQSALSTGSRGDSPLRGEGAAPLPERALPAPVKGLPPSEHPVIERALSTGSRGDSPLRGEGAAPLPSSPPPSLAEHSRGKP